MFQEIREGNDRVLVFVGCLLSLLLLGAAAVGAKIATGEPSGLTFLGVAGDLFLLGALEATFREQRGAPVLGPTALTVLAFVAVVVAIVFARVYYEHARIPNAAVWLRLFSF